MRLIFGLVVIVIVVAVEVGFGYGPAVEGGYGSWLYLWLGCGVYSGG